MTKEEKAALEANTKAVYALVKEMKNLNVRMDRLIRQNQVHDVILMKEKEYDYTEIMNENNKYEKVVKKFAYDAYVNSQNKKEEN